MKNPKKKIPPESSAPIPQLEPDMFRISMEVAPAPMLAVREDGSMIMVNQAAEHLFGYEAQELIGQKVEILLPEGLRRPIRLSL